MASLLVSLRGEVLPQVRWVGGGGAETGEQFTQMIFRFFSLLYKHVKMLLELVSIIMDCI